MKICQLKKLSCASQIGSNPGDDAQPKFFNPKFDDDDDESPKHLVQQVGLSCAYFLGANSTSSY